MTSLRIELTFRNEKDQIETNWSTTVDILEKTLPGATGDAIEAAVNRYFDRVESVKIPNSGGW